MRVLLTNDDGVEAPGLDVLQQIASELSDDVWVVAPETDQSGAAHSLTLREPLRCRTVGERIYSVKGTPTDCVIMAVRHLLGDKKPDLVLSGVNRGHNVADDVTYSGTIAGAMEGTLLGIPSIALSLTIHFSAPGSVHWETPMQLGSGLVKSLLAAGWPKDVVININFPDCAPNEVKEVALVSQGRRDQELLNIVDRLDTRGNPYYWFGFEKRKSNPAEGTDLWAVYTNRIAVTPLHLNLTHWETCKALAGALKY